MTVPHLYRRLGAAFLAMSLQTSDSWAHSTKMETVPSDGAALEEPPSAIAITFDAPVRVTSVKVANAEGESFEIDRTDAMQPIRSFQAGAPTLPPGSYRVEWRGLAGDGHPMSGNFGFTVE